MQKIIFSLVVVLSLSVGCTKKSGHAGVPDGCPEELVKKEYNFGQKFDVAQGAALQLCGNQDKHKRFWGEIFFKPKSGSNLKKVLSVGGPTGLHGPLATNFVNVNAGKAGLEVVKLIPFRGDFLPSLSYKIGCSQQTCIKESKAACRFNRPSGDIDRTVLDVFSNFIQKNGPFPSHRDLLVLYDNALIGEPNSVNFLTSDNLKDKFSAQGPASQSQAATYSELRRLYEQLVANKCINGI